MSGRRRRSLCPCLEASRLPRTFLSHVRSVARQMSLNHEINKLAHFRVSLHSAESFARKSSQLCMVRVASLWRLRCRSGIIFEQCLLSKQRGERYRRRDSSSGIALRKQKSVRPPKHGSPFLIRKTKFTKAYVSLHLVKVPLPLPSWSCRIPEYIQI